MASTSVGPLSDSFFCQAEDGIRDSSVTGVQTCALPISSSVAGNSATAVDDTQNVTPRSRTRAKSDSNHSFPPEGSLLVYENGKEVFRMPPTPGEGESAASATSVNGGEVNGSEVRRASSIE